MERSVSRPGNPHDNAVVESTNRVLKRELVRGRPFTSEEHLRSRAVRLGELVQQLQAALDAGLHHPGRVQGGGPESLTGSPKKMLPHHWSDFLAQRSLVDGRLVYTHERLRKAQ